MYAYAEALLVYLAEMSCTVWVKLLELLRLEAVLGIAVDILIRIRRYVSINVNRPAV